MAFAPGTRLLECEHCGSTEELGPAETAPQELPFAAHADEALPDLERESVETVQCETCGAEVQFAPSERSRDCAFCAVPLVATPKRSTAYRVHSLLPLDISETDAIARMEQWKKSLWFAPNDFAASARTEHPLQAMYLPFWTFDANTETSYLGRQGQEQNHGKKGGSSTRWRKVAGNVSVHFDDLAVPASQQLSPTLAGRLRHWDFSELEPYDARFLLGHASEIGEMPLSDAFETAKRVMKPTIEGHIKGDIGGDKQQITDMHTNYRDVTFRHVLVPVWLGAYRYRGKVYQIAVNGRTRRIAAERPWSIIKIALAVIAITVAAMAVTGVIAIVETF